MKQEHSGHRQRLKARFLKTGKLTDFEEHNVLELLLFFAIPIHDTNVLAHQLIDTFGSFAGVLDAPFEELLKFKGISQHSATLMKLVPQLSQYYLENRAKDTTCLNSTQLAGEFVQRKFIGTTQESLLVVCMNNACDVLGYEFIAEGINNAVCINSRKIISLIVKYNASAIILAHNHPSGFAVPSQADIDATMDLMKSLETLNVHMVDHIIVARDGYISMAQSEKYALLFT